MTHAASGARFPFNDALREAALPRAPARPAAETLKAVAPLNPKEAFELGWDFAMSGVVPPALAMRNVDFARGYGAAAARWTGREQAADAAIQLWLDLRATAMLASSPWPDEITPDYLREIDTPYCLVTRKALTRAAGEASDAKAGWLDAQRSCAVGAVIVMSAAALQAKARRSAVQLLQIVHELQSHSARGVHLGLNAHEWARLATLTALAEPGADAQLVDAWPLVATAPHRLQIPNQRWALKMRCTEVALDSQTAIPAAIRGGEPERAFGKFRAVIREAAVRRMDSYQGVHRAWAARFAGEDAWTEQAVNERWQALAAVLPSDSGNAPARTA